MAKNSNLQTTAGKKYKSFVVKLIAVIILDVIAIGLRLDVRQRLTTLNMADFILTPIIVGGVIALIIHAKRIRMHQADWQRIAGLALSIAIGICSIDVLIATLYYGIHTS